MFIFQTRYRVMTFEGIPVISKDHYIHTSDEGIAKKLRGRKDVWEVTQVEKMLEKANTQAEVPVKRPPGRPKGIRGSRTSIETQGESQ